MVRVAKGKNKKNAKNKKESVNSDSDNNHYDSDFDPKDPFANDGIESFHNDREKILLSNIKGNKKASKEQFSDEEVLAFEDSDEDYDDSDLDDGKGDKYDISDDDDDQEGMEDDLKKLNNQDENDLTYWGKKKSAYYSGNRIQNEDDAMLEEEEANILQAKMMKQFDTNDFGLDAFKPKKNEKILKTSQELEAEKLASSAFGDDSLNDRNLEKIAKNLSKMSKKEKLEFLEQESPELFELVRDFKAKINELEDILLPIFNGIRRGHVADSTASHFIINKTKLYLMYLSHLSFYFALKSKRLPVDNHPIVKNILQYRNLCKQISQIDEKLVKEIKFILESLLEGNSLSFIKSSDGNASKLNKVKKSVKFRDLNLRNNKLKYDEENESDEENANGKFDVDNNETIQDADDQQPGSNKRAINYQIEKNKGLTPKRNKMYRNPRVRNRIKARKAVIKRKSIVVNVRPQDKRYSGESTGIRSNIIRAVKIK